ncbi:hypothetical protein OG21DRAFT_1586541 [Imleria badia]|nr:hypothetical protein OG21DRAFT_1586541 [Imleria badia]
MSEPDGELARTKNGFDTFKAQHAALQRENSNLKAAVDAAQGTVVKANLRISILRSDLQTSRYDNSDLQSALHGERRLVAKANQTISTLQSDLQTIQNHSFQHGNSNAQSALDAEKGAAVKANQTISNLHSDLETAQVGAETPVADYHTKVTRFQRDISDLLSALDTQKAAVVKANQTILKRAFALKTAREEVEMLKVDYDAKVSRFRGDTADLHSAFDAQKEAVVKANQTISNLRSLLETAQGNSEACLAKKRAEAETLNADYGTKVSRFQRENSDLRSALDALKREVAEDKLRFSLRIGDFNQWMRESSVNADTIISDSVPLTASNDAHHVLAYNALLNVRSEKWSSAYEDAEKVFFHSLIGVFMCTHPHAKSIVARPSAMGYIVKALAQIGKGEAEVAMQVFDLVFGNCNPDESNLLLLIKVRGLYASKVSDTAKRPCT